MMVFPPSYHGPELTPAQEAEHEAMQEYRPGGMSTETIAVDGRCPDLVSDWDGFWKRCPTCGEEHYVADPPGGVLEPSPTEADLSPNQAAIDARLTELRAKLVARITREHELYDRLGS